MKEALAATSVGHHTGIHTPKQEILNAVEIALLNEEISIEQYEFLRMVCQYLDHENCIVIDKDLRLVLMDSFQ